MSQDVSKQRVRGASATATRFESQEKLFSATYVSRKSVRLSMSSAKSAVLFSAGRLAYRRVSEWNDELVFERGSWLDIMMIPYPHNIPVRLTVNLTSMDDQSTRIEIQMQVRVPPLLLSYRDICYWRAEFDAFWQTLGGDDADPQKLRRLSTMTLIDTAVVSLLSFGAGYLPPLLLMPDSLERSLAALVAGTLLCLPMYIVIEQIRRIIKV